MEIRLFYAVVMYGIRIVLHFLIFVYFFFKLVCFSVYSLLDIMNIHPVEPSTVQLSLDMHYACNEHNINVYIEQIYSKALTPFVISNNVDVTKNATNNPMLTKFIVDRKRYFNLYKSHEL